MAVPIRVFSYSPTFNSVPVTINNVGFAAEEITSRAIPHCEYVTVPCIDAGFTNEPIRNGQNNGAFFS